MTVAQPATDKEIVGRRARSSNSGDCDVAGKPVPRSLQVVHDRPDIGFGKQLSGSDFAAGKGVNLAEKMVVAVVRKAADPSSRTDSGFIKYLCVV